MTKHILYLLSSKQRALESTFVAACSLSKTTDVMLPPLSVAVVVGGERVWDRTEMVVLQDGTVARYRVVELWKPASPPVDSVSEVSSCAFACMGARLNSANRSASALHSRTSMFPFPCKFN